MENMINGRTKVLAVIGDPIEHSLSPEIQNTICKKLNVNYAYIPFRIASEDLKDAVCGFKACNLSGFNITIPHKSNIMQYLDEVSQEALLMGAVNTVKNVDGRLYGYNTDGVGFIKSLQHEGVNVKNKNIVIIGAGGAVRGIAVKMALEGAVQITILNRTVAKAENISEHINRNISNISQALPLNDNHFAETCADCDILINSTPIGMYPHTEASPVQSLDFFNKNDTVVCDLIYNPSKTKFLLKAEKAGCKIINGWGMLIYQAIEAFEIWTGMKIDENMVEHLYGAGKQ